VINLEGDVDDETTYAAQLARGAKKKIAAKIPAPDDVAGFVYTSGTTGNPKGVILSHLNLSANVCGMIEIIPFTRDDRTLAFLPWAHVYGGNVELNGMISLGASMAICESVDRIVDNLGEVRPTVLFAVPRIWNKIYDGVQKNMQSKPSSSRKFFVSG
jgi:long-chain acyl-CoA synthetase